MKLSVIRLDGESLEGACANAVHGDNEASVELQPSLFLYLSTSSLIESSDICTFIECRFTSLDCGSKLLFGERQNVQNKIGFQEFQTRWNISRGERLN